MKEDGWHHHEILAFKHVARWGSAPDVTMDQLVAQLKHGRGCTIMADVPVNASEGVYTHLATVEQLVPNPPDPDGVVRSWHTRCVDYFLVQAGIVTPKEQQP